MCPALQHSVKTVILLYLVKFTPFRDLCYDCMHTQSARGQDSVAGKNWDAGLARYVSVIYIGDIYPIYIRYVRVRKYRICSSSEISDIFDIFKIGYFPYFFNITLLLDVKTSLKCKNRHFKFSILLII